MMSDPKNDLPADFEFVVPLIEDTREFRRDFVLKHGIDGYVAEVNGISVEDARTAIADGRVDVAYLKKSLELDT